MMTIKEEREARVRREQDFYNGCAEILGVEHKYHVPYFRKTRWNARTLGNGRFPGYGVVRMFNASCIQVMLTRPTVNKVFDCKEDVFEFLKEYRNDRTHNIQEGNQDLYHSKRWHEVC